MKNAIRRTARWMFVSAPGVGVLVISAGLGVGYAATQGGGAEDVKRAEGPGGPSVGFAVPFGGDEDLSEADQKALESFHECMRGKIGPPPRPGEGDGELPDPEQMHQQFEAAFDQCKGELTDELRQKFEQNQQQMEEFRSCMEEQGVEKPTPGGERPTEQDREQFEKALEACRDKLPEGGVGGLGCAAIGPGPGPGGPGGPGFGPPGRGPGEIPVPPPDSSRG